MIYYGVRIGCQEPFLLKAQSLEDAQGEFEELKKQVLEDVRESLDYNPEVEFLVITCLYTWQPKST